MRGHRSPMAFVLWAVPRPGAHDEVARWYDELLMQWSMPPSWPHAISGGFAIRASLLDEIEVQRPELPAEVT